MTNATFPKFPPLPPLESREETISLAEVLQQRRDGNSIPVFETSYQKFPCQEEACQEEPRPDIAEMNRKINFLVEENAKARRKRNKNRQGPDAASFDQVPPPGPEWVRANPPAAEPVYQVPAAPIVMPEPVLDIRPFQAVIGGELVDCVDARSLHGWVRSGQEFSHWFKARISQGLLVENQDYAESKLARENSQASWGGSNRKDFIVTVDVAMHMAMLEQTEFGRAVRQNLIDWKRRAIQALKAAAQPTAKPLSEREALRAALDGWDAADAARLEAEARHLAAAKQVSELSSQNVGLSQELYATRELADYARGGVYLLSALLATPGMICLRDAANRIEQPQHAFNVWLNKKDWIYKDKKANGKLSRWKPRAWTIADGLLGDKEWISPKDGSGPTELYTKEMGWVDPNIFWKFTSVGVTHAGMVRILQYDDHPNPNAPALRVKRQELGFK